MKCELRSERKFLTRNFTCKKTGLAVFPRTKAFPNASQAVGST